MFLVHFPAVLMALVNIYSVKLAARLMTALSSLKLIAMAAIVLLGVYYFIDKGIIQKLQLTYEINILCPFLLSFI